MNMTKLILTLFISIASAAGAMAPSAANDPLAILFGKFRDNPESFDLKSELNSAGFQDLGVDNARFIELAQENLPNDALKAREFVGKILELNILSVSKLAPILIAAKKLDTSWSPEQNPDHTNSVTDRMSALKEIETRFPEGAVTAAKQAYHALEATNHDTLFGSSNRLIHRERTGNWVFCANAKTVLVNGKPVRLDWKRIAQREKQNAYEPEFKESTSNLFDFNTGGLKFNQHILDWMPYAVLAYYDRSGNCGNRSYLALYYLIKNSFSEETKTISVGGKSVEKRVVKSMSDAIKRVEMVRFTDMDHIFLIVNRTEGSNLADPKTWGEYAFIVDSWLWDMPDLRLFTAKEAVDRLIEVRDAVQDESLAQLSPLITSDLLDWWGEYFSLPNAPDVDPDNLPLSIIYEVHINDFQMKDDVGDVILLLPDMTRFTIADKVTPEEMAGKEKAKTKFERVIEAIRAKKQNSSSE